MEGDPIVDRLMKPVRATIEHYVKNQAGVIAIYNRAYHTGWPGVRGRSTGIVARNAR
jgi:hypothetical protein